MNPTRMRVKYAHDLLCVCFPLFSMNCAMWLATLIQISSLTTTTRLRWTSIGGYVWSWYVHLILFQRKATHGFTFGSLCMCVSPGSGPGLFLWPCSSLHLGHRHPGSRTELHYDRNLLRPVCYGGMSTWSFTEKHKQRGLVITSIIPVGFLEPTLVPFCSSSVDPCHRHHPHTAGGHFSGCWTSHRDERLPQRASEHAGQTRLFIKSLYPSEVWCLDKNHSNIYFHSFWQLPFALIPILTFTSLKSIMNDFENSLWVTVTLLYCCCTVFHFIFFKVKAERNKHIK